MFESIMSNGEIPTIKDNGNPRNIGTGTDYIDYFMCCDIPGNIAKGTDKFWRNFFCVKFEVEGRSSVIMQTFFQRYTDDDGLWMGCGHATINLMTTYGGMSSIQEDLVKDIISGKEVEINSGHHPVEWDWIGKKVKLWDGN